MTAPLNDQEHAVMDLQSTRVTLVSMPWPYLNLPSIQLGTVTSIVRRAGYPVQPLSLYVDFMKFLLDRTAELSEEQRITVAEYGTISEVAWQTGVGDWLFSLPPFHEPTAEYDQAFLDSIKGRDGGQLVALALKIRPHVSAFLDACVDRVLADRPSVVGFSTTFNQNIPSLNLAKRLKQRDPALAIVFGGANCDGPMGIGLHKAFPQVDYIVRGEAEYALPALLSCIRGEQEFSSVPGLVYREDGATKANDAPPSAAVSMADVPTPDYDEYFSTLERTKLRSTLDYAITLPVESSRGCWWGEKHHCTFCGLNGSSIAFRSKAPDVFAAEILALSRHHKRTSFQPVDNILDMRYFKSLLPWLKAGREQGTDYTFFYEIKANLKKEHVQMLRDAGVHWIQPGIESLSSHVLKLMDKGITALQNIRLLKWAREYGIRISWNLLYGFPGETDEDYERMAEIVPSLTHLEAPGMSRLFLERFSPYFDRHEEFGIEVAGPARFYELVYPVDRELLPEIAYEFRYRTDRIASEGVYRKLQARLAEYWAPNGRFGAAHSSLRYSRGVGFVKIRDRRAGLPARDLTLNGISAAVYLACDDGKTVAEVVRALHAQLEDGGVTPEHVTELMDDLVGKRLMYEENGRYLSLACADRPVLDVVEHTPLTVAPPVAKQPATAVA
ncbi:MAG TPA: RiPP maturation radical SAM C-methyltransferase [Dongiaceae bacterium]|nr:RiPP maturation radical SAM C-methyltransferase [Dongiaceae bacterium]